jgi:hypothetical protein
MNHDLEWRGGDHRLLEGIGLGDVFDYHEIYLGFAVVGENTFDGIDLALASDCGDDGVAIWEFRYKILILASMREYCN